MADLFRVVLEENGGERTTQFRNKEEPQNGLRTIDERANQGTGTTAGSPPLASDLMVSEHATAARETSLTAQERYGQGPKQAPPGHRELIS